MQTKNPRCAGVDVHKDTLVVAIRIDGKMTVETFGTTSTEIFRLGERLASQGVTIVAMESTGVYWRPVWNLLEGQFELILSNAQHVKHIPGCKTDARDCRWLAELLEYGLAPRSLVPLQPQRDLRDLTRQRTQLNGDRSRVVNRVQKVLEGANIKLASVASDIMGKSGRAILDALVVGKLTPEQMAELVHPSMNAKKSRLREALQGRMTDHHRFMLKQLLDQIDHVDQQIASFDRRIDEVMSPLEHEIVKRLDAVPGLDTRSAQVVIAEIGTDMSRYQTSRELASWAGLCPNTEQSAGRRRRGRIRHGNGWLKAALCQAGWAAGRTRRSYFSAEHRRLTTRRGLKRANIAVAHSLLVVCYHLIKEGTEYVDLGVNYSRKAIDPERQAKLLVKRLEKLGFAVTVTRPAA
jgi:transposase